MPLLDVYDVDDLVALLKFSHTLKTSSITNDKFTLTIGSATPVTVTDPFQDIDLGRDYDSISHILTLRFSDQLEASSHYVLTITGLINVAGVVLPTTAIEWDTENLTDTIPTVPPEPAVVIEDHSIRASAFLTSDVIYASNPDFYIVDTDPEMNELLVENDRNAGRVTIKFSARPAAHFLSSTYFKAQKKLIQRAPSRWMSIDAQISLDSIRPWVYIDFPSTDATPVYGVADATYFEDGTKYRIKISKNVGI